jgi:hypothetical protein
MIDLEYRQMQRPNGLIDDFVLHGRPSDYKAFASVVQLAIGSGRPETLPTASRIRIEITNVPNQLELFTSLQNEEDFYATRDDWAERDILRVLGSTQVLERLCDFLVDLSGRGEGYSYISEYSDDLAYASCSPEWRLHVRAP